MFISPRESLRSVSKILHSTIPSVQRLTLFVSAPPTAPIVFIKAELVDQSPIVLSHLHEDHFDNLVAEHIHKSVPIISTHHACDHLKERGHTTLYPLHTWENVRIVKGQDEVVITSMPGKHTLGVMDMANSHLHMIPPVMGSMVTFKKAHAEGDVKDYNLYISGDTLYYEELKVSCIMSVIILER